MTTEHADSAELPPALAAAARTAWQQVLERAPQELVAALEAAAVGSFKKVAVGSVKKWRLAAAVGSNKPLSILLTTPLLSHSLSHHQPTKKL